MAKIFFDPPTLRNRADLRDWLAQNHVTGPTAGLASYKCHHLDCLAYPSIAQDLLCWGWSAGACRTKARHRPNHSGGRGENRRDADQRLWDFLDDVDALSAPDDLNVARGVTLLTYDANPKSINRGTLDGIKTAPCFHTDKNTCAAGTSRQNQP